MDNQTTKSTPRTNLKKRRRVACALLLFLTFAALAIVIIPVGLIMPFKSISKRFVDSLTLCDAGPP